jgi:hypothetical protein
VEHRSRPAQRLDLAGVVVRPVLPDLRPLVLYASLILPRETLAKIGAAQ